MPYKINPDSEKKILRLQFASNSTIKDWKSALEQVERLSEELDIYRVLVDVREQTDTASASECYDFASHLPHSIAFAVLCEIQLAEHHFIELIARWRGAIVKDFDSERDAIEWLEEWSNHKIEAPSRDSSARA